MSPPRSSSSCRRTRAHRDDARTPLRERAHDRAPGRWRRLHETLQPDGRARRRARTDRSTRRPTVVDVASLGAASWAGTAPLVLRNRKRRPTSPRRSTSWDRRRSGEYQFQYQHGMLIGWPANRSPSGFPGRPWASSTRSSQAAPTRVGRLPCELGSKPSRPSSAAGRSTRPSSPGTDALHQPQLRTMLPPRHSEMPSPKNRGE